MRVPLSWLNEYVALDVDPDRICERMTMLGLEIENVERPGGDIRGVVVGRIESIERHPGADRLVVCRTDVGEGEPLQIVCGASNMKVGDKVPTARVGAVLPGGFEIGRRKMRGVESHGMMCSPKELGLGEDHDGLMILEPDPPVGMDIREALRLTDVIVEIEITPNRNDWSGMIGIARELAATFGKTICIPKPAVQEGAESSESVSSVTIEAPDLCPRYAGRLVMGVTVEPSPPWLQQRLRAAGQRPINNVVDVTNYVLLETGHPLHAFDLDKLDGKRIVVRSARDAEMITTIDEQKRELNAEMLVIADAARPVAVAGVMGGFDSEVGEGTKDIFLESAYFDPISIRRTARALNMLTEASQRFQRGADPDMVPYALDRAAQLIAEIAGGTVLSGRLDEYPRPVSPGHVELRPARTDALLGVEVSPETQQKLLESIGFDVRKGKGNAFAVTVPPRRHDCTREADLIEEIARLYGYDHIPATVPRIRVAEHRFGAEYRTLRDLRGLMTALGFTETITWSFGSPQDMEDIAEPNGAEGMVMLRNPLSEIHAGMRTSLLPGVLRTVSANLRNHREPVRIFEMGPVYGDQPGTDALPVQHDRLAIAVAQRAHSKFWGSSKPDGDIYDIKGAVEAVLAHFSGNAAEFATLDTQTYAPSEAVTITVDSTPVGTFGLVDEPVRERFEIDQPVWAAELDLRPFLVRERVLNTFQEIPAFPPSLRDIAMVVDRGVPAGNLVQSARNAGGGELRDVRVFDIYTGEPIPQDRKSVALSLTFQSSERTLTDKDTDKAVNRIIKKLQREFDAELR